jgi:monoamine oxidase
MKTLVTHWHKTEHVGMAFSYVPKGSSGDFYDAVQEAINDRVFFAGEVQYISN